MSLQPAEARWVTLAVQVPPQAAQAIGPGAHPIRFRIEGVGASADKPVEEKSTFVVPR
jgi:hypothetical protein